MKKKSIQCFLAVALLFVFAGTGWTIEFNNGGGNQLWSNGANWVGGAVPNAWAQVAEIDAGLSATIDSSVNTPYVGIGGVNIGDHGDGTGTLTMTGGLLSVGTQANPGQWAGYGWMVIGFGGASNPLTDGVLNMQGGKLEARWDLLVGAHGGGDGTINMTGGEIWAHKLHVGAYAGTGQINLNDGIIAMPFVSDTYGNGNVLDIAANGNIDIEKGQIHILGDFSAQMGQYILNNKITGYNDTEQVFVDYNNMIPGVTVVYVPEPATMIMFGLGSIAMLRRRKSR